MIFINTNLFSENNLLYYQNVTTYLFLKQIWKHLVLNYLDDQLWSNCSHLLWFPFSDWGVKEHLRHKCKIMFLNWIICFKLSDLKEVLCYQTINIPFTAVEILSFFFLEVQNCFLYLRVGAKIRSKQSIKHQQMKLFTSS